MIFADGATAVWIADQDAGVTRRRAVTLGITAGELVEVIDGLTPAERLIAAGRDGLRDGQRVTVTGEDSATATMHRRTGAKPVRLTPGPARDDGPPGKH